MKKTLAWILTAALLFSMTACATKQEPPPAEATEAAEAEAPAAPADDATEAPAVAEPEAEGEPENIPEEGDLSAIMGDNFTTMGMVTDLGGVNDESFNMLAWRGHEQAKADLGIEVSYIESHQEADYAVNLDSMNDNGAQLIWGIGFLMADAIKASAEKNPETFYAIIDNNYEGDMPANLVGITFKEQEPSFLVGYVAAKMTKTNKIGFVGGIEIPVITRFQYGYIAGAYYANPEVEVMSQYAESFNDAAIGKQIATKQYQDGCDIVFHASGATGNGVIEAAKESGKPADGGKWAIGVDTDQNKLAPDNVLTSACKTVDKAVEYVAKEMKNGTLKGGNMTLGYKEDGVFIATTGNYIPAEIMTEVEGLIEQIKSGALVVPGSPEEFETFKTTVAAAPAQ